MGYIRSTGSVVKACFRSVNARSQSSVKCMLPLLLADSFVSGLNRGYAILEKFSKIPCHPKKLSHLFLSFWRWKSVNSMCI